MHDKRVNRLTFPSFDSYSRQPSYKYAAVEVAGPAHERAAVGEIHTLITPPC